MKSILSFLKPLFRFSFTHPYIVLALTFSLAFWAGSYAIKLKVDTDIASLLPESYNSVKAIERLKETVGGETAMNVAIKSKSFEANKAFSEAIIEKALKLYDNRTKDFFFERVDYKRDTRVLEENALYLATPEELGKVKDYLVEQLEEAKLDANPFYFDLEEDDEDEVSNTTSKSKVDDFEESYASLVPREYPINADSTVMMLQFYPTGSKSDIHFLKDMFATVDSLITSMQPTTFHPTMEVRFGGRLKRHVSELESIMNDVFSSFSTGISSVLFLVMIYFFFKKYSNYKKGAKHDQTHSFWEHLIRIPIPLLVIGLPLLLSLIYTFGIAFVMYTKLNTMTSVLFVILFGMGIDYGIHFYARYLELRSAGYSVIQALEDTYDNTGVAIATSALTTAAAMYVLVYADFRGFSEFGFISGTGIILALTCMIFVLPAILVVLEKWSWILINQNLPEEENKVKLHKFPFSRSIVVTAILLTFLSLYESENIGFEYDFGKLEPEFPGYIAYRNFIGDGFETTLRNPAYILADSREEVVEITEVLKERMKADTLSPTIKKVEALPERFPVTDEEKKEKLASIAEIRELLKDPFLINNKSDAIVKLNKAAHTTQPLSLDSLPQFIRSKFVTKTGEIGNFVIVYPNVGLSDGRNSIAFKDDVGTVTIENGKEFYAASTSIVAADMLDLMITESPYMITATFIIIFILMLLAFRSLRWTIIALLPLVIGLIWMFGLMVLFDIPLNFYNLIVLPAILGIGEDNGVHLSARYIEEGKTSMWNVLSSTGQHITIGSATTMLGYMGLLFTHHPGLYSLGLVAIMGVGMTLFTALTLLPALIQYLEDKDWIHFERKGM